MNKLLVSKILIFMLLLTLLAGGSEPVIAAGKGWSTLHYLSFNGTVFRPRSSQATWNQLQNCLVVTAHAEKVFNVPLQLPQGARIETLSFSFVDNSSEFSYNSQAFIAIYDGHGGITDLAALISDDTVGTITSPFIGHIVDNATYSYVLSYKAVQTGESLRLCGMRVAYRVPAENVFLPLLQR